MRTAMSCCTPDLLSQKRYRKIRYINQAYLKKRKFPMLCQNLSILRPSWQILHLFEVRWRNQIFFLIFENRSDLNRLRGNQDGKTFISKQHLYIIMSPSNISIFLSPISQVRLSIKIKNCQTKVQKRKAIQPRKNSQNLCLQIQTSPVFLKYCGLHLRTSRKNPQSCS